MRGKIKSNSGITLLTLSLTIAIMLVLSFTIAININDYMEKEERIKLETDILKLQEKVANYYSKNDSLPIINEYTNTVLLKKNINDNDKYYVIDISKLEKIDLNYGEDYNKIENKENPIDNLFDIYIINEQSHTIYYPKGIQYKGKFYYTIEDKSNTKIEDIELAGIEITGRSSGKLNEEIQLTVNSVPKFIENSGVTWSSSNTDIAEIDENGKVTLKAVGIVTITAVSKDNETINTTHKIECKNENMQMKAPTVTVKYDSEEGDLIDTIPSGETKTLNVIESTIHMEFLCETDQENETSGYAYSIDEGKTKIDANSLNFTSSTSKNTYYIYTKDTSGNYSTDYTTVTVKVERVYLITGANYATPIEENKVAKGTDHIYIYGGTDWISGYIYWKLPKGKRKIYYSIEYNGSVKGTNKNYWSGSISYGVDGKVLGGNTSIIKVDSSANEKHTKSVIIDVENDAYIRAGITCSNTYPDYKIYYLYYE